MISETSLLSIDNVKEFYPGTSVGEHVYGKLSLTLVKITTDKETPSSSQIMDSYLVLHLPSGKTLPAPATTRINQINRTTFEIQSSDALVEHIQSTGDISAVSAKVTSIDLADAKSPDISAAIEQLQSIFAQYTIFADPVNQNNKQNVVLVDNSGDTVATLDNMEVTESPSLKDDKSPVVLELNQNTNSILVVPATEEDQKALSPYGSSANLAESASGQPPAYSNSDDNQSFYYKYDPNDTLLSTAAGISKGLIYASETLTKGLDRAASWYTTSRAPTEKPLVFKETTKRNIAKMSQITGTGAKYSHKAVGAVQNLAASLGERLTARDAKKAAKEPIDPKTGKPKEQKPGFLNRSLIAFSTVMDGVDQATQNALRGATQSSSQVIHHKYGEEARDLSLEFGNSVSNVTTVYIDARGISRRAILKGFGKGAVRGVVGNKKIVLVEDKDSFVQDAMKAQGPSTPSSSSSSMYEKPPPLPARR